VKCCTATAAVVAAEARDRDAAEIGRRGAGEDGAQRRRRCRLVAADAIRFDEELQSRIVAVRPRVECRAQARQRGGELALARIRRQHVHAAPAAHVRRGRARGDATDLSRAAGRDRSGES
jgi:hypothetical protein